MGYIVFIEIMIFISIGSVLSFMDGYLFTGIIGFVFVNIMSFTLGHEIHRGNDSDVFKKVN